MLPEDTSFTRSEFKCSAGLGVRICSRQSTQASTPGSGLAGSPTFRPFRQQVGESVARISNNVKMILALFFQLDVRIPNCCVHKTLHWLVLQAWLARHLTRLVERVSSSQWGAGLGIRGYFTYMDKWNSVDVLRLSAFSTDSRSLRELRFTFEEKSYTPQGKVAEKIP